MEGVQYDDCAMQGRRRAMKLILCVIRGVTTDNA